jgi:glycosyltransferase involved in cell wall biosynthesis
MHSIQGKRILFLNWKDIYNPSSGGAEVFTDAIASHLAKNNDVFFITSKFPDAKRIEKIHGYTVIRNGSQMSCILYAFFEFLKLSRKKKFDIILDQAHGIPFFSIFYPGNIKIITIIHEVAGGLWSEFLPAWLGRIIDNIWISIYHSCMWLTVSESTKKELETYGIPKSRIHITPNFTDITLAHLPKKALHPTLLVLGRIVPVKQIEHAITAFQIAKQTIPDLQLIIAGKTSKQYAEYYNKIKALSAKDCAIIIKINISEQEKIHLLSQSHLLLLPSKKEGYGIVILEAAACGTPTIGYNVPGVQDAIIHNKTGLLAMPNDYNGLATHCIPLLTNLAIYKNMQQFAYEHSYTQTRKHTYSCFDTALQSIL